MTKVAHRVNVRTIGVGRYHVALKLRVAHKGAHRAAHRVECKAAHRVSKSAMMIGVGLSLVDKVVYRAVRKAAHRVSKSVMMTGVGPLLVVK